LRSNTEDYGAKLTRLTLTKLRHNCTQWQRAAPFTVLAPSGQSGNFWIAARKSPKSKPGFTVVSCTSAIKCAGA